MTVQDRGSGLALEPGGILGYLFGSTGRLCIYPICSLIQAFFRGFFCLVNLTGFVKEVNSEDITSLLNQIL